MAGCSSPKLLQNQNGSDGPLVSFALAGAVLRMPTGDRFPSALPATRSGATRGWRLTRAFASETKKPPVGNQTGRIALVCLGWM